MKIFDLNFIYEIKLGKCKRGYTLSELLAYLTLLLIITLFAGTFIINSLRLYRQLDTETSLQQGLIFALSDLSRELRLANRSSLIIEPDGIIFASPLNDEGKFEFDIKGGYYWQKWICIYVKEGARGKILVKKSIPISPPALQPGTPPIKTVSRFAELSVPEKILARGVKMFTLENENYPGGYKIKMTICNAADSFKTYEITGETGVLIRN